MTKLSKFIVLLISLAGLAAAFVAPTHAARIKDIVDIEGVRENQLVGYGLVVGLNGTGDGLNNSPFTKQSLQAMLERMGVNTLGTNMRTANVAAVMVTANLPAFASQGSRIDVNVAALGDSKSLQGGTLLVTPLMAQMAKSMQSLKAKLQSTASKPVAMAHPSFRAYLPPAVYLLVQLLSAK